MNTNASIEWNTYNNLTDGKQQEMLQEILKKANSDKEEFKNLERKIKLDNIKKLNRKKKIKRIITLQWGDRRLKLY